MKKILSTRVLVKICVLTTILLVLIIYTIWGNSALMVSMVNISSDRIASAFSNFRIAQVSDLHNAEFGESNADQQKRRNIMEEMVEVRKEVSDMPCGNAIPAEDAGHQTEKDVAGRESDRVPAPEMNPKVQLELLSGEGRKKAIGAVVIYNAVTIRGISVVENSKKNPFVKMPRAPKGARTKHSDIAYPINRAAREMLYSAVLQEYDRLRSEEELRRQETKLQVS